MLNAQENKSSKRHLIFIIISLAPFVLIPLFVSQLYFRHDDASGLLWAKEYNRPIYHIFSPDPELNRIGYYPGIAGAYRPFTYFYIKVLWDIFGAEPRPYHILDGLIFMAAVFFLFRLTRYRYGAYEAVLSCLILFVSFHGMMYTLSHGGVVIGFFSQMVLVYFFWKYLDHHRWYHLLGVILLIGPALSRQTTPILLAAILIAVILNRRGKYTLVSARDVPAAVIILAGFYLMTLTPGAGRGSIASIFPDYAKILAFVGERFYYYGRILTSGLTGLIVLLLFGAGVCRSAATFFAGRFHLGRIAWVWLPAVLIVTLTAIRVRPFGPFWLAFCIVYLFAFDRELRVPLAWAGASLLSFFSVLYYHNAYLLEAAFPLSIALGVVCVRLLGPLASAAKLRAARYGKGAVSAALAVLIVVIVLAAAAGMKTPLFSDRVDLIRISIDSNRNFRNLMNFMRGELPENAVVYELDEEHLGTTGVSRRLFSLKKRAATVKILNITYTRIMLKVLEREDIRIRSASEWPDPSDPAEVYFIVLNDFEREIAESEYELHPIREFRGDTDSAVIYRFGGGP